MKERFSSTPLNEKPSKPSLGGVVAVDITDKDALRALGLGTLVSVIQANPTALAVVPALKELFDRVDGKAPQSIIQSGSVTNDVNMNFTIEFVKPKVIEHDSTIS
jgi:hypothetical protein